MSQSRYAPGALRLLSWGSALAVPLAVFSLTGFLLLRGLPTLGPGLLFGDVPATKVLFAGAPTFDGLWPACLGTLRLVFLSILAAAPVGLAGGAYLAEYGRGRPRDLIVAGVDLLAGVPSIVMGLFGFCLILFLRRTVLPQANVGLLTASLCLALLVLPYLVNAARISLEALPMELRLTGAALGLSKGRTLRRVLLPAASRGICSGLVLAVGRAAEDTAVILMTGAVANAGRAGGLTGPFEALPFQIYYLAAEHQTPADLDRGFGAALLLLGLTSLLFLGADRLRAVLARSDRTKGATA